MDVIRSPMDQKASYGPERIIMDANRPLMDRTRPPILTCEAILVIKTCQFGKYLGTIRTLDRKKLCDGSLVLLSKPSCMTSTCIKVFTSI